MDSSWNETFLDAEVHAYDSSDGSEDLDYDLTLATSLMMKTNSALLYQFKSEILNVSVNRWKDR